MARRRKWSFDTYGRTALGAGIELKGMDELLSRIDQAGKNIDDAVKKAIGESVEPIAEEMRAGASRHIRTASVFDAVNATDVFQNGNEIYCFVGIDLDEHPEAIHAVFQEYGDGHSPGFPDPFIWPAIDKTKSKYRANVRRILKQEGMPID